MEIHVISDELAQKPLRPRPADKAAISDGESTPWQIDPLWLSAPPEGTRQFQCLFVSISWALQASLRLLLPAVYFSDPKRYVNVKLAYPLLVYAASNPFRGRRSGQFTYDPLEPDVMLYLQRTASNHLPAMLRRICCEIHAAGMPETAMDYEPRYSAKIMSRVLRRAMLRKRLHGLLATDAQLLRVLMELAGKQDWNERRRAKALSNAREVWVSRFRHLYGPLGYESIASTVLAEATAVLHASGPGLREPLAAA